MKTPILDRLARTPEHKKNIVDFLEQALRIDDWIELSADGSLREDLTLLLDYNSYVKIDGVGIVTLKHERRIVACLSGENEVLWANHMELARIAPVFLLTVLLKDF